MSARFNTGRICWVLLLLSIGCSFCFYPFHHACEWSVFYLSVEIFYVLVWLIDSCHRDSGVFRSDLKQRAFGGVWEKHLRCYFLLYCTSFNEDLIKVVSL